MSELFPTVTVDGVQYIRLSDYSIAIDKLIATESKLDSALESCALNAENEAGYQQRIHELEDRLDVALRAMKVVADGIPGPRLFAVETLQSLDVERHDPKMLDDGFGMQAHKCERDDCDLHIVRPGKVACSYCHSGDLFEKGVLGADERYARHVKE